jgi:hypothetical protein
MPATFAEPPAAAAPVGPAAAGLASPAPAASDMHRVKSMVLPNPIFEGSEKRVEIDFSPSAASPPDGLRALSRDALDELMSLAACTIVSSRTNAHLDAYVLSESSLFVYPTKWVLKTCGTTKLLNAVPRLLEMAAERLGMAPRRCKYSRASFLFPDEQPAPYREGFDYEARFLRTHFGHLGNGGSAYVLGVSGWLLGPGGLRFLRSGWAHLEGEEAPSAAAPAPPRQDAPALPWQPPAAGPGPLPRPRRHPLPHPHPHPTPPTPPPKGHVQRPPVARVRRRRARRRRSVHAAQRQALPQVRGGPWLQRGGEGGEAGALGPGALGRPPAPPSGKPFHKFEVGRGGGAWGFGGAGSCQAWARAPSQPPRLGAAAAAAPSRLSRRCVRPEPRRRASRAPSPTLATPPPPHPPHKVCMTDLCRDAAAAFYRDSPSFVSAKATTADTGIRDLVPGADIDDFVFDPCGARRAARVSRSRRARGRVFSFGLAQCRSTPHSGLL